MKLSEGITQDELKAELEYIPESGGFHWLKGKPGRKRLAGCVTSDGYVLIRINYTLYKAHRLAFLYMNGKFPDGIVDHIDRNPSNNKWDNLRIVDHHTNAMNTKVNKNNTSNYNGVWFDKARNKWAAEIKINYTKKFLGRFDNIEDAVNARLSAEALQK